MVILVPNWSRSFWTLSMLEIRRLNIVFMRTKTNWQRSPSPWHEFNCNEIKQESFWFFGTVVQIPLHKPLTCRYAYPEIVSLDALKACNAVYWRRVEATALVFALWICTDAEIMTDYKFTYRIRNQVNFTKQTCFELIKFGVKITVIS